MRSTIVAVAMIAVVKVLIGLTNVLRRGSSLDLVDLAKVPWREARRCMVKNPKKMTVRIANPFHDFRNK